MHPRGMAEHLGTSNKGAWRTVLFVLELRTAVAFLGMRAVCCGFVKSLDF